tara:strand:- start:1284 stop:1940 length:657 start_codon:yes stop_codon:yes gene_type:complete
LLGYEELESLTGLPDNVSVEVLGKQSNFGSSWTTALIPFFTDTSHDRFVIVVEDLILMNKVDVQKIALLEEQFDLGIADKAVIGGGLPLHMTTKLTDEVLVFNQNINYRSTLHPSIWTKNYFLKFLKPGLTAWDFEIHNDSLAHCDGANIIVNDYTYPQSPHLFSCLNLYSRGELMINKDTQILDNQLSSRHFDKKDLKYIWEEIQTHEKSKEGASTK